MANLMFNIAKIEVSDDGTTWQDLGATQGGGRITQDVQEVEIQSDQNADPEAIISIRAPKTISVNLLDASPENLALAFGGTVSGNVVSIPNIVSGVEKQVKITTQPVNGVSFEILVARGKITGRSEINLNADNAAVIPLEIKVLSPESGDPVTITKLSS